MYIESVLILTIIYFVSDLEPHREGDEGVC